MCARRWSTGGSRRVRTAVSAARTRRRSATGPGPPERRVGAVLVVNAGSTSLKLSVVDDAGSSSSLDSMEAPPQGLEAVAHRIVHGGSRFREPVVVDDEVERELGGLTE